MPFLGEELPSQRLTEQSTGQSNRTWKQGEKWRERNGERDREREMERNGTREKWRERERATFRVGDAPHSTNN